MSTAQKKSERKTADRNSKQNNRAVIYFKKRKDGIEIRRHQCSISNNNRQTVSLLYNLHNHSAIHQTFIIIRTCSTDIQHKKSHYLQHKILKCKLFTLSCEWG